MREGEGAAKRMEAQRGDWVFQEGSWGSVLRMEEGTERSRGDLEQVEEVGAQGDIEAHPPLVGRAKSTTPVCLYSGFQPRPLPHQCPKLG